MTAFKFPDAALSQHIAIVGKTGSGKTSTAKLAVEQVAGAGARVCVLDPIKSDWWGITSSADGKRPGLPFHILGGPHGHVPLHESAGKAIGELVATGALPLSIIDMALFEPGGHAKFFVDFARTLLRKTRGVVYLVIEESHLFAPKERSGIGNENMAIHYAKLIATAGRSKGIRMMVLTQRTQALHNALLGSCDTLIAQRFTAPADQEPIVKWLKANVSKEVREQVERSLSSLPTGQGWICSGEAGLFERVAFPRIKTYDNTATPTGDGSDHKVATAPIDLERLRAIMGDAVQQAEAEDPRVLRAELAKVRKELASALKNSGAGGIAEAEAQRRVMAAVAAEREASKRELEKVTKPLAQIRDLAMQALGTGFAAMTREPVAAAPAPEPPRQPAAAPGLARIISSLSGGRSAPRSAVPASDGISAPQQRILDALAWFEAIGVPDPRRSPLGAVAGSSPKSSGFEKNLSTLRTGGRIDYPDRGRVVLTDAGRAAANRPSIQPTEDALHEAIYRMVSGPQSILLRVLVALRGKPIGRDELAQRAGVSPASSGFEKNISTLRSFELIDYPERGQVMAMDILFPKGKQR